MLSLANAWSLIWGSLNRFSKVSQSPSQGRVSYKGLCVIAWEEACVTVAYPDGDHYSIGFGHNGPDVKVEDTITIEQAWALLKQDVEKINVYLNKKIKVPLLQYEYDALGVFAVNRWKGAGEVVDLLNKGQRDDALEHWASFNTSVSTGHYLEGLEKRREREMALFKNGDYGGHVAMKVFTSSPPRVFQLYDFPKETV